MKIWRLFPFVIFAVFVFFLWRGLSLEPQTLPSAHIGKPLPMFQLKQLDKDSLMTTETLRGQVALLNVWASWCNACTEEQVFLMRLSNEGVVIYGLNYKDNSTNAKRWLQEWGNPYRAVGEDYSGRVAIDLGVYGAPETFLIDKEGVIRFRHVGVLDEKSWKEDFLPRIKHLQGEA